MPKIIPKWRNIALKPIELSLLLAFLIGTLVVKPAVSEQKDTELAQRRIELLEKVLVPQTATEAALTWAKGVKTRNGALQFAVLSPELRGKAKAGYVAMQWVTGVSSPWVESYKITRQAQQGAGWEFEIQYQMKVSKGSAGTNTDRIQVNHLLSDALNHPEGWYITQLRSAEAR